MLKSSVESLNEPCYYAGLYGFHKYWGKKPVEPLRFLISELTKPGDIVADPFLGSGAIARESAILGRKFIGCDINPIATRLTNFFLNPCSSNEYAIAIEQLADKVRPFIESSYTVEELGTASHLLWENGQLSSVWQKSNTSRKRHERKPVNADIELALSMDGYKPKTLRPLRFFQNSRINSTIELDWNSLFTGRALQNIELLLDEVRKFDRPVRNALELTLTASAGQMSNMVFAITSRGKTKGVIADRIEVGSWVIGFWCPKIHFEINVWNCFEMRSRKLQKALNDVKLFYKFSTVNDVFCHKSNLGIDNLDAISFLTKVPENSLQLLVTDPPHGDRIPYLELSEMWNGLLGEKPSYEKEIIVSNAKIRQKTSSKYQLDMDLFFDLATSRIKEGGFLVLMFNSRREKDWETIRRIINNDDMKFVGSFPMEYSATSVVQDNRKGGMKNDYIMLYSKGKSAHLQIDLFKFIPGWSSEEVK